MKIDIYTHVLPKRYENALSKFSHRFTEFSKHLKTSHEKHITLTNRDARLRILDKFEDMVQVLSVTVPPLEEIVSPEEAAELARIANDEMAEWVAKYPKRYITAIANLPLNNMDASMKEAERAVKELGFKGIQIYTSVQGKPLSKEEFMPLYKMMSDFDLPIWIHPVRTIRVPDYPTEESSLHHTFFMFGWPYETTVAMTRLVFDGIFEKFPNIKFITHHCGAMIPYFADRIVVQYDRDLSHLGQKFFPGLSKHPIEYFRMFYNDTALNGNMPGLMCALSFFGDDHLLFGSDMPFDPQNGEIAIGRTIEAIDGMKIPASSKKKIYEANARKLLHL
jgi:predicted TIM-barrel fold metal-dependent hydrolase